VSYIERYRQTPEYRLDQFGDNVAKLIAGVGKPVVVGRHTLDPDEVISPFGLLPFFMLECDRLWRELAGTSCKPVVAFDDDAMFQIAAVDVPRLPAGVVLFPVAQVLHEATQASHVHLTGLVSRWLPVIDRCRPEPAGVST
jgi:hypothetical protein